MDETIHVVVVGVPDEKAVFMEAIRNIGMVPVKDADIGDQFGADINLCEFPADTDDESGKDRNRAARRKVNLRKDGKTYSKRKEAKATNAAARAKGEYAVRRAGSARFVPFRPKKWNRLVGWVKHLPIRPRY